MNYTEYFLRQASIFELRNIARDMGVLSPTIYKKEELINKVLKIQNGEEKPQMPKSRQGRPPKSVFNKQNNIILSQTEKFISFKDIVKRSEPAAKKYSLENTGNYAEVLANPEYNYAAEEEPCEETQINVGYFSLVDNEFGFIFDAKNLTNIDDVVFVPQTIVKEHNLRTGDMVEYKSTYIQNSTAKFAYEILSINGEKENNHDKPNFDSLQIISNKNESFIKSGETNLKNPLSAKRGTRNIICVNNMLQTKSVRESFQNLKDYTIVNLKVDVMAEDIFSLPNSSNIENFYTTVGESNKQNVQTIILVIERIKRLVESGKKVVVLASEAKKIIKHQNFSLDYSAEDIKYKSLDLCYQLLNLARTLKSGAEVTTFLFLKQDSEPNSFEKYIKEEFDSLSCNFFNL